MTQRLYRIEVDQWPTEDGKPWARYYDAPGHDNSGGTADEWPEFVARVVDDGELPDRYRLGSYADPYEVTGFVCPQVVRKHYLSRTAAESWCRQARTLGAVCRVVASDPITWQEADAQ